MTKVPPRNEIISGSWTTAARCALGWALGGWTPGEAGEIGAGTPPIIPSWGNIMAEGRALWQVKPYIVFFPAAFLSVTVLAVNLVGDGLRDALDPRMAKNL